MEDEEAIDKNESIIPMVQENRDPNNLNVHLQVILEYVSNISI